MLHMHSMQCYCEQPLYLSIPLISTPKSRFFRDIGVCLGIVQLGEMASGVHPIVQHPTDLAFSDNLLRLLAHPGRRNRAILEEVSTVMAIRTLCR